MTLDRATNAALGDLAAVPLILPNGQKPVAAVFVPGGFGQLDSHIVVYPDRAGRETFVVHYAVQDDDRQTVYLHQGSYDLSYGQAIRELNRRVTLNLSSIDPPVHKLSVEGPRDEAPVNGHTRDCGAVPCLPACSPITSLPKVVEDADGDRWELDRETDFYHIVGHDLYPPSTYVALAETWGPLTVVIEG